MTYRFINIPPLSPHHRRLAFGRGPFIHSHGYGCGLSYGMLYVTREGDRRTSNAQCIYTLTHYDSSSSEARVLSIISPLGSPRAGPRCSHACGLSPKSPNFCRSRQEVGDRNPAFGRRDLLGWESTALETAWKLPNLVIVDILGDFPKTYDELFRNSKQQR